jgi:hypothetical protein
MVERIGRHAHHMIVSDRRGRICHCTEELATMLGHTPHSIRMGGMQHALGMLIPQPFATLHRGFVHVSIGNAMCTPIQSMCHACGWEGQLDIHQLLCCCYCCVA